jgi:hypothetical protein
MELMQTAWSSLTTGAATAAAPVAGAATTAAPFSLFGGGGFGSTLLQGTQSLMGAMSSIRAGDAKAKALEEQARQAEFEAGQEAIKGVERRVSLKQQLYKNLGEQSVSYASGGVDLSFGTPQQAQNAAIDDANRALTLDGGNEEIKRSGLKTRAAAYRSAASETQDGALFGAVSPLFNFALSLNRRG